MQPFGLLDNRYSSDDPRFALNYAGGGVSGETPTNADALGRLAYGLTNLGGVQDAAGLLGGPSLRENVSGGNYLDAALQGVGVLPVVGGVAKGLLGGAHLAAAIPAARSIAKAAKPAEAITEAVPQGIVAYHGSPHSFDKFSLDKIGAGEGAQVYGHGLYFADNEDVAKSYRDNLLHKTDDVVSANTEMKRLSKIMDKYEISYGKFSDPAGYEAQKLYNEMMDKRANAKGSMYQVKINADPEHFLDWDKPLSEQPPKIQEAYNNFLQSDLAKEADDSLRGYIFGKKGEYANPSGKDFYSAAYEGTGPKIGMSERQQVTEVLKQHGIPGIKYLDQGSRNGVGNSSNYVVFDDKLIDILKKYGLVGLLGGGMAMNANQQQSQPGL